MGLMSAEEALRDFYENRLPARRAYTRALYDAIVDLRCELEAFHDDPILNCPDYRRIKALAACYELQDYLAGQLAALGPDDGIDVGDLAACPICGAMPQIEEDVQDFSVVCSDDCPAPRCTHAARRDVAIAWNTWVRWYRVNGD